MGDLLLTNARVLDGLGQEIQRSTVRLAGERVVEVGPGAAASSGARSEVIDLASPSTAPLSYSTAWPKAARRSC